DRPNYGAALLESWGKLANYYEFRQQQEQLRCLDQAVKEGRRLSAKFPTDPELHYRVAEALNGRAEFDAVAGQDKEALVLYEECVETFRTRVCAGGRKPTDYQLGQFLQWADKAQECASRLKRTDDVLRLAGVAHDLGHACTVRAGLTSLDQVMKRCGGIYK